MAEIDKALGSRLRTLRRRSGFETALFCDLLAISETDLAAYEEGSARIPAPTLFDIAHLLRTPLEEFFNPRLMLEAPTNSDASQGYPTFSRRRQDDRAIEMAYYFRFLSEIEATAILRLTASIAHRRMPHRVAHRG